jgi:pimeloyl-ACP methyl ester carboxylesterase
MANFVLVHGAWHGGWCWRSVASLLRREGHQVITPTLTGLADRSHLMSNSVDMHTHIDDVINAAKWAEFDDFVLCGHSYGGAVITGVAERIKDKIRAIVYLDALLPEDGQSACDAAGIPPPQTETWPAPPASRFVIRDPDMERWVDRMMTPHPLGSITQPLAISGAYDEIPRKIYVLAGKYSPSPFHRIYERLKGLPSWSVSIADCGHHVMVDLPDLVVGTLIAASSDAMT